MSNGTPRRHRNWTSQAPYWLLAGVFLVACVAYSGAVPDSRPPSRQRGLVSRVRHMEERVTTLERQLAEQKRRFDDRIAQMLRGLGYVESSDGLWYREEFVGLLPEPVLRQIVAPNGLRVAVVTKTPSGRERIWVDGSHGPPYDEIRESSVCFSPDSRRLAYHARIGNRWIVVVDDTQGPQHEYVRSLVFSPDGRHVAYRSGRRVSQGQQASVKWQVVVDGNGGREYDDIWSPVLSPDGTRVAYQANTKDGWVLVVQEQADGKYVLLPRSRNSKRRYVGYSLPAFSFDGARIAYRADLGDEKDWVVMVDNEEGPQCDSIWSLLFSQDGTRLAYWAKRKGKELVVVHGKAGVTLGLECDQAGAPVFSPDGKRVAYWAKTKKNNKEFVVVYDGQRFEQGAQYDHVGEPMFGPDGKLAYWARSGSKEFVVVDGKEGPSYDQVGDPVFSSTGESWAYRAKRGDQWFVVVSDKGRTQEGKGRYKALYSVVFSYDGAHLAYRAQRGEQWLVVVDGREGPLYDEVMDGGPTFEASGRLEYLARRDRELYRVSVILQTD